MNSTTVVAATDILAADINNIRKDIIKNAGDYVTTAGTSPTYTASIDAQYATYVAGDVVKVKIHSTNTGASTININSIGAKTIKKNGTSDLIAGDFLSGEIYILVYDGTYFQVCGGRIVNVEYPDIIPNFNTTVIPTYTDDVDNIVSFAAGQIFRTRRGLNTGTSHRYIGTTAMTILSTALLASANNTSVITMGGYHYAYIGSSTPDKGFYRILVTGDMSSAGNWTTLTLSGAGFTATAVLIGYDGTNFWFTDASSTFFKATLSGTTLTQGSAVTVTGSDYSANSRVNSVGIYAHFAAAPTIRQASLAGALVANNVFSGPTIVMATPLYFYVCSASTNPLVRISF